MKINAGINYVIACLLFISACNRQTKEQNLNSETSINIDSASDSTSLEDTLKTNQSKKEIKYTLSALNDSVIIEYLKIYNDTLWENICALNRIDPNRLHRADSIIIPDTVSQNLMDYSPFPIILEHSSYSPKIIFVSYAIQAFALYRNDSLIRWGPVSMGAKKSKTPTGLFHTNWKSKRQISTEDSSWVLNWYFNINNSSGVSFHEYDLPGFPASHSCIRMRKTDAEYLYYFADQWQLDKAERNVLKNGTPVIIFGNYPWGKTRPWFHLSRDQNLLDVDKDSLEALIRK